MAANLAADKCFEASHSLIGCNTWFCWLPEGLYIYIYIFYTDTHTHGDEVDLVVGSRTRILTTGPYLVPQEGLDSRCMSEFGDLVRAHAIHICMT